MSRVSMTEEKIKALVPRHDNYDGNDDFLSRGDDKLGGKKLTFTDTQSSESPQGKEQNDLEHFEM